jgi:RNA polymerase sigma factor (sigma-70 family)
MSNEELVSKIKATEDEREKQGLYYTLYQNNLPLIKKTLLPYSTYAELDDLLQESYFSVVKAADRFDATKGSTFGHYLVIWVKQHAQRYIDNFGSSVRLPVNFADGLRRYKRFVGQFYTDRGRYPNKWESADALQISPEKVEEFLFYGQGVQSLDAEVLQDDSGESLTLSDTLESPDETETEVIEEIYTEYQKIAVWSVVDDTLTEREAKVLKLRYKQGKSLQETAEKLGISKQGARYLQNNGLSKLHRGDALRRLRNAIDGIEQAHYSTSFGSFVSNDFTSSVELKVLKIEEIRQEMYQKYGIAL